MANDVNVDMELRIRRGFGVKRAQDPCNYYGYIGFIPDVFPGFEFYSFML